MFSIKGQRSAQLLELIHEASGSYARIALAEGGRLQALNFNGQRIIRDLDKMPYTQSYASSILFPFVNRIKDGVYSFEGRTFQLDINESEKNNAHHGLMFNQCFKLMSQQITKDYVLVELLCPKLFLSSGYPFLCQLKLSYTLYADALKLDVEIQNQDSIKLPYALGWHPYFYTRHKAETFISIKAHQMAICDERGITVGFEAYQQPQVLQLGFRHFDDCYALSSSDIGIATSDYELKLSSSYEEGYLQIYTPPYEDYVAIEPTTAPSDSFNNSIGLQVLPAGERVHKSWLLEYL